MIEFTLYDSNLGGQEFINPFIKSERVIWKKDNVRRKINVYTDNFIKKEIIDIPNDGNYNICLLLEPYTNPAWTDIYQYIRTDFEKFDLVVTHNLQLLGDLINERPDKFFYSTKHQTTSWGDITDVGLHKKTKNISMVFSYKNFSEGHRVRHMIYEKYKNTNLIDFYGSGVEGFSGERKDAFIPYKYSIACENSLQLGYNSEKINDCFLNGTIPIYWGSRFADKNYDENSILYFSPDVEKVDFDFEKSLSNLDNIIQSILNEDNYEQLYNSIKNNYEYSLSKIISEDNLLDILKEKKFI
jgi:hypothetical protein